MKNFFVFILIVLIGCAGNKENVVNSYQSNSLENSITQTLSINDQKYHSIMTYDSNNGKIKISFVDYNDQPAKIFEPEFAKAILIFPDNTTEELYFRCPEKFSFAAGSQRAINNKPLKTQNNVLYAQKTSIKYLSTFSLWIWLPFKDKTYLMNNFFSENIHTNNLESITIIQLKDE